MNNKTILFLLPLFLIVSACYATNPFPDKIVKTSDEKIIVKLVPWGEPSLIIENEKGKIIKGFSLNDLSILTYELSTAGSNWYQNSIAFINKTNEYYIVRLRQGKTIIVSLKDNILVIDIPKSLDSEINQTLSREALRLLNSEYPEERQTGAIACGQMDIRAAIPKLKELLLDDSYFSRQSGNSPWVTVYFVRKAAKEALEAMGESVKGVIVEEQRDK